MNAMRPGPAHPHGVPTLTEVIDVPVLVQAVDEAPPPAPGGDAVMVDEPPFAPPAAADASVTLPDVEVSQIVQHVLADLQRHADLMLEYRLREALAPVLARLTDELVDELRQELAGTLRDVVSRAVSQELARRRFR